MQPPPQLPSPPQSIEHRRQSLQVRLDDGYIRIENAIATGQDVTEWETFWLDLLEQYKNLCDEAAIAA